MDARALEAMDAIAIGDENRFRAADEKTAFDHADDKSDACLEPRQIVDGSEAAIENAIAAVGDEGLARGRPAQLRGGAERLEGGLRRFEREGDDLDGNRRPRSQAVDKLGPVNDDDKPTRRIGSFAFIGLLRCMHPRRAIWRNVSDEMPPVRMIAGIA